MEGHQMARKPAEKSISSPVAGFEQMATHLPEMMLSLTRIQATVFDACLRQNIEILDFLKQRFERDRDLARHLTEAAEPADAAALWGKFLETAAADYADEPRRITTAMAKAMTDALAQARHDAEDLMEPSEATAI
jgi:hypothetical protein